MNRNLVFDLATANWIGKREDALFVGPPGSGKSHCAQAIGHAVIQQGYRVLYREAHALLEDLADVALDGKRKDLMEQLTSVPLLIIDDLGMRKLPLTAAEELLEIIMRSYLDVTVFHHSADSIGAFAVVGMGAVFAGIVRAPMTSVLIIFEMTGGYGLVLPLMIANMSAFALARHWRHTPVYEALLAQDELAPGKRLS